LTYLIDELVKSEKKEASTNQARLKKQCLSDERNAGDAAAIRNAEENGSIDGSGRVSARSRNLSAAAIVSEVSFPLSVVEVESQQSAKLPPGNAETNDNLDNSTTNNSGGKQQLSPMTNISQSPTASSSGEGSGARGGYRGQALAKRAAENGKRLSSSDDCSSSSEAKNMRTANENLDRNVRWHMQRMMDDNMNGPKDDVTGASVTANNATARLSSLQHVPKITQTKEDNLSQYEKTGDQSSSDDSLLAGVEEKKKGENLNASDDSGYRESNDSREETSSSGSDTSNSNGRRKKTVAPTCRMCIIRKDMTTMWCEVTSSIRTRTLEHESPDSQSSSSLSETDDAPKPVEVKELLLCLRPIGDGEKKVDESLRFVSPKNNSTEGVSQLSPEGIFSSSSGYVKNEDKMSSEKTSSGGGLNSNSTSSSQLDYSSSLEQSKGPPKKRPLTFDGEENPQTKRSKSKADDSQSPHSPDTEKSVVESLMLMNKSQ